MKFHSLLIRLVVITMKPRLNLRIRNISLTTFSLFALSLCVCCASSLRAETPKESSTSPPSWTRFRGPNGTGVIESTKVPLPWSDSDVRWKIEIPGSGNSSPVLWKDTVYVFTANPTDAGRELLAVELKSGNVLWRQNFPSDPHPLHQRSSYASSTPVVDENGVYIAWGVPNNVAVRAFTHDGKKLWSRDLGRYVSQHGFGTSPIIVDGKLIFVNSQDAEELPEGVPPGTSSLIALDITTGKTIWENQRLATRVCYGVPCVIERDGKKLILGAGTREGFFAIDAATGETLWNLPAFDKRIVSSAVMAGKLLISTCGSGGGGNELVAISTEGEPKEVFKIQRAAPYVPTPVVANSLIFLWADNGIVTCADAATGKVQWQERIGGNVSSSPIIAGDRLIGISEDGVVTILKAGAQFERIGEVKLEETIRSTPAVTQNELLIRTEKHLLCISAK